MQIDEQSVFASSEFATPGRPTVLGDRLADRLGGVAALLNTLAFMRDPTTSIEQWRKIVGKISSAVIAVENALFALKTYAPR